VLVDGSPNLPATGTRIAPQLSDLPQPFTNSTFLDDTKMFSEFADSYCTHHVLEPPWATTAISLIVGHTTVWNNNGMELQCI
jgi:hypothetical protein